jgi:hypothetical protein
MFATVVSRALGYAPPAAAARPTVDQVIRWNRTLLQIIRTPGAQPIQNYWNEIAQTAAHELLGSGERGGFEPDLRRAARPTRPDLRHCTGREVRTACYATTFNLAERWVWCQATAAS